MEERLRFEWVPLVVWKIRAANQTTQGICYGWTKSIFTTKKVKDSLELHEEWVYDFYYDTPPKQRVGVTFDRWIGEVYDQDKPYLNNLLWEWIQENFKPEDGFSGTTT